MKTFSNNNHKILWADCIDALQSIEDGSVDLIFADPPYNIGKNFNGRKDKYGHNEYLEWAYKWLALCVTKLKKNGSLYVMTSTQYMPYFDIFLRDKMHILGRLVWSYDSSGVQAKNYYGSMYEPILYAVKDKDDYTFNADEILVEAKTGAKRKLIDYRKKVPTVYNSKKVPGNVWQFSRVRYRMEEYENHPTQKPVALLDRIIRASSNKGDTILDPFSGTFTTSYVAKSLDRKSIGIEIEEEYVKIGLRRLEISDTYNGKKLKRQPKIYEVENENTVSLFTNQTNQ